MSARYRTMRNSSTRSTASFKPLLSIPKMANGGIGARSLEKQAGEAPASREEDKDNQRDDERDSADHREHRRAFRIHPAALLPCARAPLSAGAPAASSSPTR